MPLSLVHIFVAVARRLGIAASPTDFPHKVLAHVSSPNPALDDIYVDVFASATKAILSTSDDIPSMLQRAGVHPSSILRHISPSPAGPMLIRATRNIMSSLQMLPAGAAYQAIDVQAAMYAAYCVMILVGEHGLFFELVPHLSYFPLDSGLVLQDMIAPCMGPEQRSCSIARCEAAIMAEEEAAKIINRRSENSVHVEHFVGMVFGHARQNYVGCIRGWEVWSDHYLAFTNDS